MRSMSSSSSGQGLQAARLRVEHALVQATDLGQWGVDGGGLALRRQQEEEEEEEEEGEEGKARDEDRGDEDVAQRWQRVRQARQELEARLQLQQQQEEGGYTDTTQQQQQEWVYGESGQSPAPTLAPCAALYPTSPSRREQNAALAEQLEASETRVASLKHALAQARNAGFAAAQDAQDAHRQLAGLRAAAQAGAAAERLTADLAQQLRAAEDKEKEAVAERLQLTHARAELDRLRPLAEAAAEVEALLRVQSVARRTFAPPPFPSPDRAAPVDPTAVLWALPAPTSASGSALQRELPQLCAYVVFAADLVRTQHRSTLALLQAAQRQEAALAEQAQQAEAARLLRTQATEKVCRPPCGVHECALRTHGRF